MSENEDIRSIRLAKLERLRELGMDPYAQEHFAFTHSASQLFEQYESLAPEGSEPASLERVRLAGRLVSYRLMGKAGFAHLSDGDQKIQIYVRKDDVGEALWEAYQLLDIGDHVGVEGYLFTTKTGEKSIYCEKLVPLSKALHVIPLGKEKDGERYSELSDVELRYRHRHLDLIANPDSRRALLKRSEIVREVRHFFDDLGYLEVETPMLQLVAGGAAARPFTTHYNAYELDVKLRISLELYLKRILCGDVPRVYEIGRVFRNEGVSNRHNPEFTLLEFYEAYGNLETMMERVEGVFRFVSQKVFGTTQVDVDGVTLDFGSPWKRIDMLQAISDAVGVSPEVFNNLESLKDALKDKRLVNDKNHKRIDLSKEDRLGGLIEKLLEVFIEDELVQPTFVVGYPVETSPLAKHDPQRPGFTRRFEAYAMGREVANAFSEINDPIDQRQRFEMQMQEREKGDDEAHPMDEEFLYALECGMPPTGGCGIGIDRMVMLLTGAEVVREILMFPMMKPHIHHSE